MKSTLILLLIAITFSLTAQHSYIPSERTFTTKDGLSSDKIHALHKDSKGFIWIGTENGLDRFDGQNFVHFNKNTHPEMTLDRVQMIFEDDEGYLWLVEKNKPFEHYFVRPEINFYHTQTGEWLTLEERFGDKIKFNKDRITFVKPLEDGSIFLFINYEEQSFIYQKGNFTAVKMPNDIGRMSDIQINKKGEFIFESVKGIHKLDRYIFKINKSGEIIQQVQANAAWQIQSKNKIYDVKLTSSNHLVGAKNLDAYQLIAPDLEFVPTNHGIKIDQTTFNKEQNLVWLKDGSQIFVVKPNGDIVYQKAVQQDNFEMPLLFDGHTTWYSDKQHGLVALTLSPNYFQTYQTFKEGFNNSARGIYADKDGDLFISTISGILHKSKGNNDFQFEYTSMFTPFLKDKNNQIWSFRELAFSKYDLSRKTKKKVPYSKLDDISNWSFYLADDNHIWTYNNQGYLCKFNITTGEKRKVNALPFDENIIFDVYHIQKSNRNTVWLCTSQGLYEVNNNGKLIAQYNNKQTGEFYLPTFDVHHMYIDKKGLIWLATSDGLISWQPACQGTTGRLAVGSQQQKIKHYTIKDGLSCNILHAVYEDDYEYLWLSSNEGLMQFDKQTGKVVTYTTENGLLHNEFNRISHFQAEDGKLYFGGLTGVISFHPKHFLQVRHEGRQEKLVVTDFQQFSAKKGQFENLTQELTQSQSIRLKPNDRFFKLNIALLDFKNEATYQYRIRDLYDWQTTTDSELNISGLPYGSYTLEIKAFNENQNEAANTLSFVIYVLRPFYLQWWFLVLILGSIGTSAFYFLKWRTQQMLVFQETEQLRQLDKMKSQFFANISHELRTPITLILAPLSQLLKQPDLQEKYKRQISNVHQNGKNLLNLVNEVLDLSKLEANKLALHLTPTKIPQFIERVVANFESAAKVKGIEYQFLSFLQKGIVAQFDQTKLETILNNLLSNALKFTPKEGTIQVMVTQIENDLVIKVKDSGQGISSEDLPNIFDRYYQSKDKSTAGGTGIGLALTKELIELMNGQVSVQSELDEGTEFEVRLPVISCQLPVAGYELTDTDVTENIYSQLPITDQPEISTEKDTILLVEDNPSLQQFIQSILTPHYNVIVTENGVEALEELRIRNYELGIDKKETIPNSKFLIPNLILSDVMMPEMDGFTLLEKVKADDRFCSIPFILLTARADMNDKLKGLRIGVDDYMTKPFEVEELLLRIKNLIQNAKSRTVQNEIQKTSTENIEKQKTAEQPTSLTRLDRVITSHQSPVTSHDLTWLKQVETIAQREIKSKQYNLDDLAAELYMSKSNLSRKIKRITGLTPMRYLRLVKLQKAKTLLESGEITLLQEVCLAVGFSNTTHFSNMYEAEFGKRPHEYLNKMLH